MNMSSGWGIRKMLRSYFQNQPQCTYISSVLSFTKTRAINVVFKTHKTLPEVSNVEFVQEKHPFRFIIANLFYAKQKHRTEKKSSH